jgi:nitric oxide reductase activation protein
MELKSLKLLELKALAKSKGIHDAYKYKKDELILKLNEIEANEPSEEDKNNEIFNYKTTGCNRDGLAIRTALHMMEGSGYFNKILIVLSDCKPNDTQCIPDTGIKQEQTKYAGATGIIDTAFEVKKGINNGSSILCVFTGEDEDLPTAKKIYGHNFARIYNPDRFAEIVGVLMQNQLKNL